MHISPPPTHTHTYTHTHAAHVHMLAEKCSFKIGDNPLIHALDLKLQVNLKILWDYLRGEEYQT